MEGAVVEQWAQILSDKLTGHARRLVKGRVCILRVKGVKYYCIPN